MKRLLTIAKAKTVVNLMVLLAVVVLALPVSATATTNDELQAILDANYPEGLPRYITPEEQQWLEEQQALGLTVETFAATAPPSTATWSPGEYEPLGGILVRWTTGSSYDTALRGSVAEASRATYVWCAVESSSEETAATTAFTDAGADMNNVGFLRYPNTDSIWIRDYGPRYFYAGTGHAIMDHTYNRPSRPNDDAFPSWLAGYWSDPLYDIGLIHGGGNYHCFSNGDAFSTTLILDENPGYTDTQIKKIFRDYFNVNLTIYPRLTLNVDATGHLDMWFLPLGDNKVLISEFPTNHPISKAITDAAAADMAARGYTVYRIPAYNSNGEGSSGGTHYTYTNAIIANDRVIIPKFGGTEATNDTAALAVYQSALPSHTIVQVDCSSIISLAGAVHCIMKHVYTATTPVPIIEVTSPNGGEGWLPSTEQSVQWTAADDVAVTSVNLYYSTDNGGSWNPIATGLSDTGSYNWTTPSVNSTQCLIKAIAYDAASNFREDLSDSTFTISNSAPPAPDSLPALSDTITTNSSSSGRTSATFSHTVPSGDDRLLVVSVMIKGNGMVGSITYAGNNLIKANTSGIPSNGSSGVRVENWYLVAPPVGTADVVVTFAASVDPSFIAAANFTNVDQDNPLGQGGGMNKTSGTSITTDVTTLNDYSLIFGAVSAYGGDTDPFSPGSGITELWDNATGTSPVSDIGVWGGSRPATTAGTYTFNTTAKASDDSAIAALEIRAKPVVSCTSPEAASSPTPSDGATNVSTTQDLSWTAGSGAASHDIYFGTTDPPPFIQNQAGTTYDTGTLSYNTTYYWRIDEKNDCGTTTGILWSFNTTALVPDVVGMTQSDANTAITDAGLIVGDVTQECSNTVPAGSVISQSPIGGTTAPSGSAVDLVVSSGQPSVPDVTGMDEASAIAAIDGTDDISYGSSTTQCSDTVPQGNVISQSAAGTVACGTVVDLVISSGQPSVSGYVTEPDVNTPVEGVFVEADNSGGSDTTDANGYYEFTVTYEWSGTVTLSKEGYSFDPNGMVYNNVTANLTDDYTAYMDVFYISGYAVDSQTLLPLSGVSITPDNNGGPWTSKYYGGGSTVTDDYGYYRVVIDYNWSGSIVPSKYAYAFQPGSITYTDVTADITETQDYAGTLLTYKITGSIKNVCEVPIEGVVVEADNGGNSDTTDANGCYEVWVDYNWSGTVTPSRNLYVFDPNSKTYTTVLEDRTGQDYTACNIYDLDCDGLISYGDVAVIAENWLATGQGILGDFDEDEIVNFLDFAEFAEVW